MPAGDAAVARAWGAAALPDAPGRDTGEMLAAAAAGDLGALVIAGVDPADLPDPAAALAALEATGFVVSLELRASAVTDRADVVLPVAAVAEKGGTFVNWEGRTGTFGPVLRVPAVRSDLNVLASIADEMDVHLGLPDAAAARRELAALASETAAAAEAARAAAAAEGLGFFPQSGTAADPGGASARAGTPAGPDAVRLSTWHQLLDAGRMQDGEPNLAGTARPAVAKMSAATAAQAGTSDGGKVTVATDRGAVTVAVEVTDMPDRVVWLPTNATGCAVRAGLGAGHGSPVTVRSAQ